MTQVGDRDPQASHSDLDADGTDRTTAQRTWLAESEVQGPRFDAEAEPSPRLAIIGAVPLSAELASAAAQIGWRATVIDPRARFATPDRFPAADEVLVAWPTAAFARIGGLHAGIGVVALTHAAELDDEALIAALDSDAFYVGAMGSRNTQRKRRDRLAAAGVAEPALARLAGPAGLDLGGRTRAEAALAILAEAVGARHGRAGGRLSATDDAIHAGQRP